MTSGYRAYAAVRAECDATGHTRLTRLRSDGPLAVRATHGGYRGSPRHGGDAPVTGTDPTATVYLVGAAAGPLGGDDLKLDLEVGPGARLAIRSVATTLTLPGVGTSRFTVRARVDAGGHLDFAPEPTVAAAGCHHRAAAAITLAEDATLRWFEEIVLGRHREKPGRHSSRIDLTRDGAPLLRHELRLDDPARYSTGPVLGTARAAGSVVLVSPGLRSNATTEEGLAVLPLSRCAVLVSAIAPDAIRLRHRLTHGESLAHPTPIPQR